MDNSNLTHLASQLVIDGFADKYINREVNELIHTYRVGGVILFSRNIGTPEEELQLTTDLQKEARKARYEYQVRVIILLNSNIRTPEEVLQLTTDLQKEARKAGYDYPLLICVDQENGIVRRLGDGTTVFPGAMAQGATDHPRYAYDIGYA